MDNLAIRILTVRPDDVMMDFVGQKYNHSQPPVIVELKDLGLRLENLQRKLKLRQSLP
jgi:hypothetical protein